MRKLIKKILREGGREGRHVSDTEKEIKFVLDEDLVDTHIEGDITYVDFFELRAILPDTNQYLLSQVILYMGLGQYGMSANGTERWLFGGEYHRLGGPARIEPDGYKGWYLGGENIANYFPDEGDVDNRLQVKNEDLWYEHFHDNFDIPYDELNESVESVSDLEQLKYFVKKGRIDLIEFYGDLYVTINDLDKYGIDDDTFASGEEWDMIGDNPGDDNSVMALNVTKFFPEGV